MALTIGTAPFSEEPAGQFDVTGPARPLLFWEPFPKRLRVIASGANIADSRRVVTLHETGQMMRLGVPAIDVRRQALSGGAPEDGGRLGPLTPYSMGGKVIARAVEAPPAAAAALHDLFVFDWEQVDAWYLEDELGYAHPRDPYHRFDVHRTSRHVVVRAGEVVIAETRLPAMLFETGLAVRYYLPPDAVRADLLRKSETVSQCPYKGDGQHWHVVAGDRRIEDAGWSLAMPMSDALTIPRWFSFYTEKLTVEVDGETQPSTQS